MAELSQQQINVDLFDECKRRGARIAELESKLAEERADNQALMREIKDAYYALCDAPEINPSNYDHDQVCALNREASYAHGLLHKAIAGGSE